MARVVGPLFSLGASGEFRNAMEFRTGGGKTVVTGIRNPPNNRTPAQLAQAQRFQDAINGWRGLSTPEKANWATSAQGTGFSAYQLFLSEWFTQNIYPPDTPTPPP